MSLPSHDSLSAALPMAAAPVSRGHAARHLFSAAQLRESLSLSPQLSARISAIAGAQAAAAVLLAIVAAHASPWPQLVGFAALGALAALFGRFAPLALRRVIVARAGLLLVLAVGLPSLAALWGWGPAALVGLMAVLAGLSSVAVAHWRLGGPGAVIVVFAIGAALQPVAGGDVLLERVLATAAGGVLAWLLCAATDPIRLRVLHSVQPPVMPEPQWRWELRAGARIALGAGLAAAVAHGAGWHYPAWAAIGCVAVMQGAHLHITMSRALQRMAGTVVGAFIVWAILGQHPGFWAVVACVVLFQFLTECIIGFNYALGQITVTPMALLMTTLAAPAVDPAMPVERVWTTLLGAGLGLVLAVLLSSVDERRHLAQRAQARR